MATTLVRVEEKTHATLRRWSETEHKPISQIVTELVEARERERFWQSMREGYERLHSEPSARRAYEDEVALLEGGSMDGLENEEPYYSAEEAAEIERHARSQGW